ncbi:hypothetical protein DIPPA_09521 [Diplonema papillatum]|nr:hypothetical protein DIPPA_09521 [Diplonema papillatum]
MLTRKPLQNALAKAGKRWCSSAVVKQEPTAAPVFFARSEVSSEVIDLAVTTESAFYPFMHTAAYRGDVDLIKYLASKGANINRATKQGVTPLMAAAVENQVEACSVLLSLGARVNMSNASGATASTLTTSDEIRAMIVARAEQNGPQAEPTASAAPAQDGGTWTNNAWWSSEHAESEPADETWKKS